MPITVAVCLTGISASIGATLKVYSNPISLNNHGSYVTDVTKSSVTGTNCPFTITNIPDFTTVLRFLDITTYCVWDIPVGDNDVCDTCDLGYQNTANNLTFVTKLNVGNMTGTCLNNLTDYVVNWYGPNDPNTLKFVSGKGTIYSGQYEDTFPLIGSNSRPLPSGQYVGKIIKIALNGVKFSVNGESGSVISPELEFCSIYQNIEACTCSNGNFPNETYFKHQYSYTSTSLSSAPEGASLYLDLNPGQQYLYANFEGQNRPDTFRIKLERNSGSNYYLENLLVGTQATDNLTQNNFNKSISKYRINRLYSLSQFNIVSGDRLKIDVIPNPSPPPSQTNWVLKFGCKDTFTFTKPCLDTFKNKPYPIVLSSITPSTVGSCGNFNIKFKVSGCSYNDNLSFINSDFYNLLNPDEPVYNYNWYTDNVTRHKEITYSWQTISYTYNVTYNDNQSPCGYLAGSSESSPKPFTVEKTILPVNKFRINVGNNPLGCASIYDKFKNNQNALTGTTTPTYSTSNTNLGYYKFIRLYLYRATDTNKSCLGENLVSEPFYIHVSTTITSGVTSGSYWVDITTPPITYNSSFIPSNQLSCYNDYWVSQWVADCNYTSNQSFTRTFNYGITPGAMVESGWSTFSQSTQSLPVSQSINGVFQRTIPYTFYTIPFTDTSTPTVVTSLVSTPVNWTNHFRPSYITPYNGGGGTFYQTTFYYTVKVTSLTPLLFGIYAYNISNFDITGTPIQIYDNVAGVLNTSFFV